MDKGYYVFFDNGHYVDEGTYCSVKWSERVDLLNLSDLCNHCIPYNCITDDCNNKSWVFAGAVTSDYINDYLCDHCDFKLVRDFLDPNGIVYGRFFDASYCLVPKAIAKSAEDFFDFWETEKAEEIIKSLYKKFKEAPREIDCKLWEIVHNTYKIYNPNDDIFDLILQGHAERAAEEYLDMWLDIWKEIAKKFDEIDS